MLAIRHIGFWIYEVLWSLTIILIRIGILGDKPKTWYQQRQKTNNVSDEALRVDIMYYCSSLGEYERIKPFLSQNSRLSKYQSVICFFSPSGYNVIRSQLPPSNLITYAPIDTKKSIRQFIGQYQPKLVVFSTNPLWPNLLRHLLKNRISYIYVGSSFYPESTIKKCHHWFFNGYLKKSNFIHVVDNTTSEYLSELQVKNNVYISGDPRFSAIKKAHSTFKTRVVEIWKGTAPLLVCGSTHLKDEALLTMVIHRLMGSGWKVIIAPHDNSDARIKALQAVFPQSVLIAELSTTANICIANTWGILKHLYQYADVSYIGGGYNAGIHNIMEPLIAGSQVVIGPRYQKFAEARWLMAHELIRVAQDEEEILSSILSLRHPFDKNKELIKEYINGHTRAVTLIENDILHLLI